MNGILEPERIISLLMIASAAGGFIGQVIMGAATLARVRTVINERLKPVEEAISHVRDATCGRLDVLEGRVSRTERCEQCRSRALSVG